MLWLRIVRMEPMSLAALRNLYDPAVWTLFGTQMGKNLIASNQWWALLRVRTAKSEHFLLDHSLEDPSIICAFLRTLFLHL